MRSSRVTPSRWNSGSSLLNSSLVRRRISASSSRGTPSAPERMRSGCATATRVTKSHSPSPSAASASTSERALSSTADSRRARLRGVNQPLATLRNVRWTGGSISMIVFMPARPD